MRPSFLRRCPAALRLLLAGATCATLLSTAAARLSAPGAEGQESTEPSLMLELEAPDGTVRQLPAGEPVLTDPRSEGAWVVRVLQPPGRWAAPVRDPSGSDDGPLVEATLLGGDRLRGRIVGGEGESLTLAVAGAARLPLAIDALEQLVLPDHLPAAQTAPLEAPREGDRIYRRTGTSLDRDDGAIVGFEAEGLRFESAVLGERLVPWDELAAVFVEALGEAPELDASAGVPIGVDLLDGSRLRGACLRLDATELVLGVGGEVELSLPLTQVGSVTVLDGRVSYLSSLTPREERGRGAPFGDELGLVLGHALDRNVMGGDLRVAGRRFGRGIGMHAPSRLVFELPAGWTHLRGRVGIDDSTARLPAAARGSVVFRVLWNGAQIWESDVVRGGDGLLALPMLPLGSTGEAPRLLELEVDPVEDFRGDRANWVELLLVRRDG